MVTGSMLRQIIGRCLPSSAAEQLVDQSAVACFASSVVRRRLNEFAPPGHSAVIRFRHHMFIRAEERRDWNTAHAVNLAAFGRSAEADLVDNLRDQVQPLVSLVAEVNGVLVGHIMFTPVSLSGHRALKIMGLAPLAVAPAHQCKGVGSALVRAGLDECRRLGFGAVVVLGDRNYYHRFGFSSSARFDIGCEYGVPEGAFMVMELQTGFLGGASRRLNTTLLSATYNKSLDASRGSAISTTFLRHYHLAALMQALTCKHKVI